MKILFMGSAAFAVPALEALAAQTRHKILEIVSQPDKPAGRGMGIHACPVAETAKRLKLPLRQPESVRAAEEIEHFRSLAPDMIVIIAYGKILPRAIIDIPPKGAVNVHASLLPKYRGAAPINWAIVNGERETGVTTMFINEEMDAGDIIFKCATPIDDDETSVSLHDNLAGMGADLLLKTIETIEDGGVSATPQDHSKATFAPMLKKEDGRIKWSKSAWEIYNRVRGLKPWPGTFTTFAGGTLAVHEAAPFETEKSAPAGTVIESGKHLAVACGKGALYLLEVQPAGKRRMKVEDFLRGHRIEEGEIFK